MVSIIIVNYDTKDLTFECIESIYQQTKEVEFQIIVVDNASSDGSVAYLRKKFPLIDIIECSSNLGFGRANNLGAKIAKGDFLFLLNSDTKLIENSIFKLHKFFIENQTALNLGVVGCKLIDANFQLNNCGGDFPTIKKTIKNKILRLIFLNFVFRSSARLIKKYVPVVFYRIKEIVVKKPRYRFNENVPYFEVDQIIGANLFMRRSLFNKFEGFSNDFFMYAEETDLQKKIANSGFSRIIYTETKLIHYEGGSGLVKRKNLKRIISDQSLNTYFKRNEPKNYNVFRLYQYIHTCFAFLDFRYSLKENLTYQKAMFSFLIQKRIYGIHT
jgi:GT2 family glycosyltransferase